MRNVPGACAKVPSDASTSPAGGGEGEARGIADHGNSHCGVPSMDLFAAVIGKFRADCAHGFRCEAERVYSGTERSKNGRRLRELPLGANWADHGRGSQYLQGGLCDGEAAAAADWVADDGMDQAK